MRFEIPEQKQLVHTLTLPIRWGDMDVMGHVNNTIYFRYMEIIRLEWLRETGVPANPAGLGPVIVNAFCNFQIKLKYPGEVLARLYTTDVGRTSFDTYTLLSRTDDPDTIYASGGSRVVWVDFPRRKSAPLPDRLRELLTQHADSN
ncbi:MAG TPA: thioesterase family protein [Thiomonas arsenitoxydans]|uniref:acyl-CoA thioesterase n=1 Tax=Thiomonas TaxID=32012 RepID=UPI002580ED99|nr:MULTISPECIES: thioesterase family protein [Thiomonas]HML81541.1 thioesterase family protein [Thiomonas arsenitoxydans]